MKPHVGPSGCVVKVVLSSQTLGKLDDRVVMGHLLGYDGGYRLWIPKMRVREIRDVVFYEGEAPMTPVDGRGPSWTQPTLAPPPRPLPHTTESKNMKQRTYLTPRTPNRVANGSIRIPPARTTVAAATRAYIATRRLQGTSNQLTRRRGRRRAPICQPRPPVSSSVNSPRLRAQRRRIRRPTCLRGILGARARIRSYARRRLARRFACLT